MQVPGDEMVAAIRGIQLGGQLSVEHRRTGNADIYLLTGKRCRIEITIDATRWLGLSFALHDINGNAAIHHDIDTDLYNISQPKYREFAVDIESEIVQFLDSLVSGKIRVGEVSGALTMIFPCGDAYFRIKRGRIFASGRYFDDLSAAESTGRFERLCC